MATTLLDAALAADRPRVTPEIALDRAEAGGPPDADVAALVAELGITKVLHFTTNAGFVGVLDRHAVLSRSRLPAEARLEHVYKPNAPVRKDPQWSPFVNMSITRVNDWMLSTSSNRRAGEDIFWVVLSFDPVILCHPGVVFTTTNNIYPSNERSIGTPGLAAQYAPEVTGRYQSKHVRSGLESNQPTDRQAEVLYPHAVPIEFLRGVYVQSPSDRGDLLGVFAGFSLRDEPPVVCAPEIFR